MVAVGIHYKAFHFLVGANVDGAVKHGDIVVDLSQHNGDVFVQIFTCGLVCVGTSFFNQSVKIRIRDETAVASSTLLRRMLKGVVGVVCVSAGSRPSM